MAAILRFGAEQLFKEDDQQAKESSKQMMEEDIDAILGRAEVVDAGVEKNEVRCPGHCLDADCYAPPQTSIAQRSWCCLLCQTFFGGQPMSMPQLRTPGLVVDREVITCCIGRNM